ncbi:hypothetical protein HPB51_010424 [Rhipicephalus microplus]|uniref:CCHC-type domain-containing protein n=1 Tax=Rhipicephalus microplus TaxID=6941 RepID=A0A9J6F177_RHIMP|nr:hypothetical protein HPB51_010424 [Rhipicephalus microplus]
MAWKAIGGGLVADEVAMTADNLNTVSDVIRHCRTFEALKTRRITPKFGRLANVTTVASVDASPQTDLSATIRQIVREELLRHEEQTRYAVPRCASVAFRDAVCASPPATWQHSVNAADCNSYRHDPHYGQTEQRHYDSIDRRFDQHPRDVRPRRPSTAYDIQGEGMSYSQPVAAVEYFNQRPEVRPLPVCYNCGTPGHIARYCNRRRAFSNGQSGSFMQHGGRAMDTNRPGNTTFEGYFREEGSRHFPLDSYSGEQERVINADVEEQRCYPQPAPRLHRKISDIVRHLRMEKKRSQSCGQLLARQQYRGILEEMLASRGWDAKGPSLSVAVSSVIVFVVLYCQFALLDGAESPTQGESVTAQPFRAVLLASANSPPEIADIAPNHINKPASTLTLQWQQPHPSIAI